MTKSTAMFAGYCETLRKTFDAMSDEEYAEELKKAGELIKFIGYEREAKNENTNPKKV